MGKKKLKGQAMEWRDHTRQEIRTAKKAHVPDPLKAAIEREVRRLRGA